LNLLVGVRGFEPRPPRLGHDAEPTGGSLPHSLPRFIGLFGPAFGIVFLFWAEGLAKMGQGPDHVAVDCPDRDPEFLRNLGTA